MPRSRHVFLVLTLAIGAVRLAADKPKTDLFKNFEYPLAESKGWPHQLEWLKVDETNKIGLVNGKRREPENDADEPFSGLTLESVQFGDVTGDGQPEAIVVLRYDTGGGTQYSHYVYVYSLQEKRPVLLAYFRSGDRAASGRYRVYAQRGELVVELFDPEKQQGDCCSDGFVRRRFKWTKAGFQLIGQPEFGTPKAPSRIPVDTFGNHH